jgi:hypothetical protein
MVLALLDGKDLSTESGRQAAYDAVVSTFVHRYGGEKVLNEPRSQLSWVLPYAAILGGLCLLGFIGSRWIKRGRAELAMSAPPAGAATTASDDEYNDKLDDELRDVD